MASLANLSALNDTDSLVSVINGSTFEDLYEHLYGQTSSWAGLTYASILRAVCALWLSTNAYVLCLFVLMLNSRHLVTFYTYLLAFACLPVSFLSHYVMTDAIGASRLMTSEGGAGMAGNLNLGNAEWMVHRYASSVLPVAFGVPFKVGGDQSDKTLAWLT